MRKSGGRATANGKLRRPGASALSRSFIGFVEVLRRLRDPQDGCPWDIKQTPESLRHCLLEETYETMSAIGDVAETREELGDLLLVVLMIGLIHEERSDFALAEVIDDIRDKIIRRHPHVFGTAKVKDAEEVLTNWTKIKSQEKKGAAPTATVFANIPAALPALMKARRVDERLERMDLARPAFKVAEKLAGLRKNELVPALYTLVQMARAKGIDAELDLDAYCEKVIKRYDKKRKGK